MLQLLVSLTTLKHRHLYLSHRPHHDNHPLLLWLQPPPPPQPAASNTTNALPHADAWTAHYKTLSVAVLKEQVKAKRGAQALEGAMDKAELVQMLVDCTPAHEWPDTQKTAEGSKKGSLDGSKQHSKDVSKTVHTGRGQEGQ